MKPRFIPVILSSIVISISCQDDLNNKLIGNWASYSKDAGYTEFYIRDSTIQVYSHWLANMGMWKYTYKKDTISYDFGYKGQLTFLNDRIFILSGNQVVDTFYRIQDSIIIYNNETMSMRLDDGEERYLQFIKQFSERIKTFELQHKIEPGLPIDSVEIETEEIHLNR